jgi:hypothetical protein
MLTKISSLPNSCRMNLANDSILRASKTSSWWNITFDRPIWWSFVMASLPLVSFLAVNTTVMPKDANCFTISSPMPLFAPVTTAYLYPFKPDYVSATTLYSHEWFSSHNLLKCKSLNFMCQEWFSSLRFNKWWFLTFVLHIFHLIPYMYVGDVSCWGSAKF